MSGKGKKVAAKGKSQSKSSRAGLQFPVARVGRFLKNGRYAKRISSTAPIFLTAVLEYLTAEVLELAGTIAKEHKKTRIVPRHLALAIRTDDELGRFLSDVTIATGGVVPHINEALDSKKK